MWSNLQFDLLSNIFSYLSPDSLARAKSTCKSWHICVNNSASWAMLPRRMIHPPWFIALPTRNHGHFIYAHNPSNNSWHLLPLDFIPNPIRPIGAINGLILLRETTTTTLQLAICNPFTRQFRHLPKLNVSRTNPAVGVIELNSANFKVYVAGGLREARSVEGGASASYEPTLEVYDSIYDSWKTIESMPMEFVVRLTVWTSNESAYCDGVLYWISSARDYTVIVFEIGKKNWRELSVPMADRLEFAGLVPRNGKLNLVGGTSDAGACIWELSEGNNWRMIEKVPQELGARLLGGKGRWGSINTKCVCIAGAMCLYRDLGSRMVVWRECARNSKWEWHWIEGCDTIKGMKSQTFPIKGLLLHPCLASSSFLNK
ncbi:F-box protein At5g49610-like [Lycium barbarum]|uniref:F-box protein At5g49610-like n=1 Tax=Lycium barbarum TaxID=112863 RepID=UPI00293E77EA|nr:F-box protein At5g49610-like [Lycium barbarum]